MLGTIETPSGVVLSSLTPHWPHPPQEAFLWLDERREVLYGGAVGGGKSDALLMAALKFVHVPGYAALILRKTFADLALPGAIMDRAKEWLSGKAGCRWNENSKQWTFESGATLTFGYLQTANDKYRYQGSEYQFVGFDELTQFDEADYRYLLSRIRKPSTGPLSVVPLRMRSASNPGGRGHNWVRARWGLYRNDGDAKTTPLLCHRPDWPHPERVFIPAKIRDNPSLDAESYLGNLEELDHHTRAQLLEGDWDARPPGDLFRAAWFEIVDTIPAGCRWVRFWDLAATERSESNPDPDWTVGLRLGAHPNGLFFVEDVIRRRRRSAEIEARAKAAGERDGIGTRVLLEQEPGSSGKTVVDHWIRNVLPGRAVRGIRSSGSKFERATVASSRAERGLIKIKRAPWNTAFLAELEAFSEDDSDYDHDDQVDALSGAIAAVAVTSAGVKTVAYKQRGGGEPVVRRGDLTLRGRRHIDTDT